jgi:hypothetical protein
MLEKTKNKLLKELEALEKTKNKYISDRFLLEVPEKVSEEIPKEFLKTETTENKEVPKTSIDKLIDQKKERDERITNYIRWKMEDKFLK